MDRTREFPAHKPLVEIYSRYLPELIIEKIISAEPGETSASAEQFHCAVMFADISGFTPLTEKLAAQGEDGTEKLTTALNAYFTPLITLVRDHGGDVVKFAGDALIAIWREREGADDLATAAWRAGQCGLRIQSELKDYQAEGSPLTLRVAIGAGSVAIAHVGGQLNRWEFIISGRPLDQVGIVSDQIQPGSVGISPEVLKLIESLDDGDPETSEMEDGTQLLTRLADLPERCEFRASLILNQHEDALKKYLPGAIVYRISEGQDDYLGELRQLTILFVNLPDLGYHASIDEAQNVMLILQSACYRYEGSINKLSVDDKGVSLLAAFGLPPMSHSDDPDRGVKAALAIQEGLMEFGLRSSIGITTGRVYCGAVGSDFRREYTIMGDAVNSAARLMQNAGDGILCDATTRARTAVEVSFDPPRELVLKGKAHPIQAHRPLAIGRRSQSTPQFLLVGRESERGRLTERLDRLLEEDLSATVVLEAEAGMGKTAIVDDFIRRAGKRQVTIHHGAADSIEKSTSYFVWQQILGSWLNIDDENPQQARELALESLTSAGHRDLAPLLNDVLSLGLEDSELTRQMTGGVRASNTRKLIVDLMSGDSDNQHHVLIIDDAHWMDSASWTTLLDVTRQVQPLLTVLVTRPLRSTVQEYDQMRSSPDCEHIVPGPMSADDIHDLVAARLGIDTLPEKAVQLIQERAEGHPYVSVEIGFALRDTGVLEIRNGQGSMAEGADQDIDLPDTIQGMITARIDRLSPSQAMTIKVASVIGRAFRLDALAGIYPNLRSKRVLMNDLKALETLEITPARDSEDDQSFLFKHLITQKVAYRLMLADQRRQLHAKLAEWFEKNHDDLVHHYPLLAYHWGRAGIHDKALDYFLLAANKAMEVYANSEAEEFLLLALAIAESEDIDRLRYGSWLRRLAMAQRDQTRLDDALETVDRATEALGSPSPKSKLGFVVAIIWQALRQIKQSYLPSGRRNADEAERLRLIEAAEAYDVAMIVYYWRADKARMFHSVLTAANLAAATGEISRVLIRAYSNLGIVTGILPLRRAADYYCSLAERLAREDNHPPTLAWVLLPIATYSIGIGRFEVAEKQYDEAIEISTRLGDERHWSSLTAAKMLALMMQGRLYECLVSYRLLHRSGLGRDDRQAIIWGLAGQARIRFRLGDYSAMAEANSQCEAYIADCTIVNQVDLLAINAIGALLGDDDEGARERIIKLSQLLTRPSQVTFYPSCIHMGFAVQEACRRRPDDDELHESLARVMKFIRQFARIFPIGESSWQFLSGLDAQRNHRPDDARKAWRQTVDSAETMGMPYEMALALTALEAAGESLPDIDIPARRQQLMAQMGCQALGFPFVMKLGDCP